MGITYNAERTHQTQTHRSMTWGWMRLNVCIKLPVDLSVVITVFRSALNMGYSWENVPKVPPSDSRLKPTVTSCGEQEELLSYKLLQAHDPTHSHMQPGTRESYFLFLCNYMPKNYWLTRENVENLCQDRIWPIKKVSFVCGSSISAINTNFTQYRPGKYWH